MNRVSRHRAARAPAGREEAGYSLVVVPPGDAGWPLHSHRENEEMFFVLSCSGELRLGGETLAVKTGGVTACRPGGPEDDASVAQCRQRGLAPSRREHARGPEV